MNGSDAAPPHQAVLLTASAACLALSFIERNCLTAVPASACCILQTIVLAECRTYHISSRTVILTAVLLTAGTLLMLYAMDWNGGSVMSRKTFDHLEGAVYWAVIYPTSFLALTLIALLCNARFNRILIAAFTLFVSMGLCVLQWVAVQVLCRDDIDVVYRYSQEMTFLLVDLVLSAAMGAAIAIRLKDRHVYLERREVSGRIPDGCLP